VLPPEDSITLYYVGMNVAAGPELAAAVTNAGGLGVIGGHGYTPKVLRLQVRILLRLQST
jgi:NAD(P)H-dependent flavin oxidoreductase YrpB (nitropropane dioxygenase family)